MTRTPDSAPEQNTDIREELKLIARNITSVKESIDSKSTSNDSPSSPVVTVFTVPAGSTSAQIISAFSLAKVAGQDGYNVIIQFEDGTYTLSESYTFDNMPNVSILGNVADTGKASGKSVVINLGANLALTFTDCKNSEFRYIEMNTSDTGAGPLKSNSDTRLLVKDCFIANSELNDGRPFRIDDGAAIHVVDSTVDYFYNLMNGTTGFFIWDDSNTASNGDFDPYILSTSVYCIMPVSFFNNDVGGGYNVLGHDTSSSPKFYGRGMRNTSGIDIISEEGLLNLHGYSSVDIQSDDSEVRINSADSTRIVSDSDLELEAGGDVISTAIAGNSIGPQLDVHVISGTGVLGYSASTRENKQDIETMEKERVDNIINNLAPRWYRFKKDTDHSYYGLIADEVEKIDPRFVAYQFEELDYIEDRPKLNKDGKPRKDRKGNLITKQIKHYKKLEKPVPKGVHYKELVVPLLAKVKELESRLKRLEGV